MEENIENLMLKSHRKLNKQLFRISDIVESKMPLTKQEFLSILDNFAQEVSNHFHIEEETIFDLSDKFSSDKEIADTFELMQQHGEITGMIKHIQKNARLGENNVKENISKLKEKLLEHINFEDKNLYPEFDKDLNEEEKREVERVIKNNLEND